MNIVIRYSDCLNQRKSSQACALPVIIGREPQSTLRFENDYVSRKHAIIDFKDRTLALRHVGDTHKTIIQTYREGKKTMIYLTQKHRKHWIPISDEDTIYIFPYTIKLEGVW